MYVVKPSLRPFVFVWVSSDFDITFVFVWVSSDFDVTPTLSFSV